MHRPTLLLLSILLSVATAATLLLAAVTMANPAVGVADPEVEKTTVRRFYDAANEAITTGDFTLLDLVVARDFIDHEPLPGLPAGLDGLKRHLASLRQTYPEMRLEVETLLAEGDQVMAGVRAQGAERGRFLGLLASGRTGVWQGVERFRVTEGRIAERWAASAELSSLQALHEGIAEINLPSQRIISLDQLTFAPGAKREWTWSSGPRLILVESGSLTVEFGLWPMATPEGQPSQVEPATPSPAIDLPPEVTTLAAGDPLLLPGGAIYALRASNAAFEPAVAIVLSLEDVDPRPAELQQDTADPEPGLSELHLAGGAIESLAPGRLSIKMGHITLATGAALRSETATGMMLFSVTSGELSFSAAEDKVRVTREPHRAMKELASGTIGPGDGTQIMSGKEATLISTGDAPATILVFIITPGGGSPAA